MRALCPNGYTHLNRSLAAHTAPELEEWPSFSRSGLYRDDSVSTHALSSRRILTNISLPTPMCHSHRSSPPTSAQTSVVPKEHRSITRLTSAALQMFPHPHIHAPRYNAGNIALLHPCATLPCHDKLLRSLNPGHEGVDTVQIPESDRQIIPGTPTGYDLPPSSGVISFLHPRTRLHSCPPSTNPTRILRSFSPTHRAALFHSSGLVSQPFARFPPGCLPFLHRITSHTYIHATQPQVRSFQKNINKSPLICHQISIKSLPLHLRYNALKRPRATINQNIQRIMAVTKFVRAQDILKEKGFKTPPFDTAAFQNAVVEYFQAHEVSAKLEVVSMRFVELADAPLCGFAMTEERRLWSMEPRSHYSRRGHLIIDEPEKVYSTAYIIPPFLTPCINCDEEDVNGGKYILRPIIVVDEPYATNAVALLKMAGFIVSRKHKWRGYPAYTVTLV